jgi:hypothetical protein
MGAIASGGVIVLNEDVVAGLGLEAEIIRRVTGREGRELARREQLYREGQPMADPAGRTTIRVATAVTAASYSARRRGASERAGSHAQRVQGHRPVYDLVDRDDERHRPPLVHMSARAVETAGDPRGPERRVRPDAAATPAVRLRAGVARPRVEGAGDRSRAFGETGLRGRSR